MSRQLRIPLAAIAALFFAPTLASAALLVNDTWLDGTDGDPASPTYSENGVDADADGDLESAWFQGGTGTLDPVGAGGPLRGNIAATSTTSSASWTTYFTPDASPVTLANAGDKLRITWAFTPTTVATNTNQSFRLAIVDSPNAARLAANGSPGDGAYSGYAMFMNMSSPNLGNTNPFQLMERTDPATASALLSAGASWAALANGATSGNAGYASGGQYTYVFEATRTAAGALDIISRMTGAGLDGDGVAEVLFTDATPNGGSFSFDTFAVRPSRADQSAAMIDTSLFRVEFIPIPEPTAAWLMSVAVAAGALGRRRR